MRQSVAAGLAALLLGGVLSGCGGHVAAAPRPDPCTPPAGGRCAADVAWHGGIALSPDGRTLGGIVLCGGTLHAAESAERVEIRLHVGAVGAGGMACARVPVTVQLAEPLGGRPVYDAVSGHRIPVGRGFG
jgi:hypothetical protein